MADSRQYLFSRDEVGTAELVLGLLRERRLTLATAESCTGGLVAGRVTDVPGSSDVFRGAIVAYDDEIKQASARASTSHCSPCTARSPRRSPRRWRAAHASGVGADVAVSVTGVAGPGGGSEEKPVGLVFLHASGPMGERDLRFSFPGDRETIRSRSAVAALHLVRRLVTES